jgi:hypothetical protein
MGGAEWDEHIVGSMKPGCVTFAWDDGEIRTVEAPAGTLQTLQSAWEWIDPVLREFERGKGKPRSLCFRLADGQFRGLRFPEGKPGTL